MFRNKLTVQFSAAEHEDKVSSCKVQARLEAFFLSNITQTSAFCPVFSTVNGRAKHTQTGKIFKVKVLNVSNKETVSNNQNKTERKA